MPSFGATSASRTARPTSPAASPSTTSGNQARAARSWWTFGRKPADTDQAAFQGIHALNPLIVIDEACGVPKSIFDAVDALATNNNARVLAIGNPDDQASHFAEICKPGSGWHVITISAFDTPAFTGEEVPEELLPLLVSPQVGRGAQEALGRHLADLSVKGAR